MSRRNWLTAGTIGAAIIAVLIYFTLQSPTVADGRAMMLPADSAPLVAETATGEKSFVIEIADDPSERERGLMFREKMDAGHGMLFIFEDTRQVGFWMKNTPLPLDLVFIGEDGTVRAIRYGEPLSEAVIAPEGPVRFVLELNAGIAEKAGIRRGDHVRHPAIDRISGAGSPG